MGNYYYSQLFLYNVFAFMFKWMRFVSIHITAHAFVVLQSTVNLGLLMLLRYDGKTFIHTSSALCPLAAQVAAKTKARFIAALIKVNL